MRVRPAGQNRPRFSALRARLRLLGRPWIGVSLRTRLTAWYGVLLALTLLGFSLLVYFTLQRNLYSAADEALQLRAESIRRSVFGASARPNTRLLQPEDLPPEQLEARPLDEFAAPGIYPQAINARGGVVFAPPNLPGGELPVTRTSLEAMRSGRAWLETVTVGGDANVRVLTVPLMGADGQVAGAVQVGQSLSLLENTLAAVSRLLWTSGVSALLIAMVAGWTFTRRTLAPVARMTATARHIARTGDYRQRIGIAHPRLGRGDELFFLATTFNDMIARLDQLLESQRRLLADTSHELRNPLTVVRGNLALLRRDRLADELRREAVQEAEAEAARMSRLVTDLLFLARADAGEWPAMAREPLDLGELAEEVALLAGPRAGGRAIEVMPGDGRVSILGDRDRLKQLLTNLVENAVRHTPEDGHVWLRVEARCSGAPDSRRAGGNRLQQVPGVDRSLSDPVQSLLSSAPPPHLGDALMIVQDDGVGIAREHLPHLFERFYRVDRARTRDRQAAGHEGGTGLGLPIALSVAQAHGGTIAVASDGPGQGSTFTVRLPLHAYVPVRSPDGQAPASVQPRRRRSLLSLRPRPRGEGPVGA